MQLCHAQRQLLSRCTLRSYSASVAPASKTLDLAASDTPVPRLKRPLASSFGGIDIQNVVMPTQKPRSGTNRSPQSGGSDDKSPDMYTRRKSQTDRFRGNNKSGTPSMSGWNDGLVSLSFSNRLKLRQRKMTTPGTDPLSEAQPRKQQSNQSKPIQHHQMHDRRRRQKEHHDGSLAAPRQSPRPSGKTNSATKLERGAPQTAGTKPKATSMTRPSSPSTFKRHAQPATTRAPTAAGSKEAKGVVTSRAPKTNPSSNSVDRSARLTTLSSTNLDALFRTRDGPSSGVLHSALHASMTARVRSVLERSAGDYSRFLPRRVGMRKNASRLPALRTAHHALAVQRDVSLEQRRVALHIIEGLAQPHQPQVRA